MVNEAGEQYVKEKFIVPLIIGRYKDEVRLQCPSHGRMPHYFGSTMAV